MDDNKTQQWYTIEEGALEELGHIQEIASNLEDLINIGIEQLFEMATTQHRASDRALNLIRLYELLVELGLGDYPYDYYVERIYFIGKWSTPTATYKMEDGKMLITMTNLSESELAHLSDTIKDLEESGTIKLLDPYEEIRELINEAFSQAASFSPEGNWEKVNSDPVEDLPQAIRDEIIKTVTLLDHDRDYPQYKVIRRLILQHLGII